MKTAKIESLRFSDFYKQLISYVLVFILPLGFLLTIGFQYIKNSVLEETLKANALSIKNATDQMNAELNKLKNIVVLCSNSKYFYSYYWADDFTAYYDVQRILTTYKFTNDFIKRIVFYNKNSSFIYSDDMICTLESYLDGIESDTRMELQDRIDRNTGTPMLLHQKYTDKQSPMLYMMPLENSGDTVSSYIWFEFMPDSICLPTEFTEDSMYITMYHLGLPFFGVGTLEPKTIAPLTSQNAHPVMSIIHENRHYYLNTGDDNSIQSTLCIPESYIEGKLRDVRDIFIIIIFSLVIFGILIISISMRITFVPLRMLFHIVQGGIPNTQKDFITIKSLGEGVKEIMQSKNKMEQEHLILLREKTLLGLIKGDYNDQNQLDITLDELSINFIGGCYRVLIMEISNNYLYNTSMVIHPIQDLLKCNSVYVIKYLEQDRVLFLISNADFVDKALQEILDDISKSLYSKNELEVCWGMGCTVHSTLELDYSYRSAYNALKYRMLKTNSVYLPSEADQPHGFIYPDAELSVLYNAIVTANPDKIRFSLKSITEQIQLSPTIIIATCLFYDIINTVVKATYEIDHNVANIFVVISELSIRNELKSIFDIISMVNKITDAVIENAEQMISGSDVVIGADFDTIIAYINNNFSDQNFSLKLLSSHYNMSMSNFSHYFKRQIGINISDYLTAKKIEMAKKLLLTTGMTVTQIVQEVGYIQISNFIKKFKNIVGMTPGKFREEYQRQGYVCVTATEVESRTQ